MRLKPGKQTIAIHILPNISRSKGNQTIKFRQLIKYNMRNIIHTKNMVQKLVLDPLSGKLKLTISLDQ